jgi:hypothetical protein
MHRRSTGKWCEMMIGRKHWSTRHVGWWHTLLPHQLIAQFELTRTYISPITHWSLHWSLWSTEDGRHHGWSGKVFWTSTHRSITCITDSTRVWPLWCWSLAFSRTVRVEMTYRLYEGEVPDRVSMVQSRPCSRRHFEAVVKRMDSVVL